MRPIATLVVREVKHHFLSRSLHHSFSVVKEIGDTAAFDLWRQFRRCDPRPLAVRREQVVADDAFMTP